MSSQLYNQSLLVVDALTGSVKSSWNLTKLASYGPGCCSSMVLVEGVSGTHDELVFSAGPCADAR